MTFSDKLKQAFPFLLLFAYGLFMCGYFFLEDYSNQYRLFARFVFFLGLVVFVGGIREIWRHPLFQVMAVYMLYLLFSGLWSEPMEWFRLGQKLTISVYILSFITITHFLVHWDRKWFERMLQVCVLVAAVAAPVSLVLFYRENAFPSTRLMGIGALTNINEFSNVYGVFGILAMGFALQTRNLGYRVLLLSAIGVFIAYAWFGQSRTAFVSIIIALLALMGLMQREKALLYTAVLALAALVAILVFLFPDAAEQALLRGKGYRPLIWSDVWAQAKSAPIVGHGLISTVLFTAGDHVFETAHNAYLQVFWHGGIIGLGLFLLLLAVAFRTAWSVGRQTGDYTVVGILLFTTGVMITGVDTLIERPRDQWMLFWFPIALLLGYQTTGPKFPALLRVSKA